MPLSNRPFLIAASLILALLAPVGAAAEGERGAVTNLPIPRFVSVKGATVNVRRGPSLGHRIDWILTHKAQPLEITAEHGHWRRVRDREGIGGWVHYALLSGTRTVIVDAAEARMLAKPDPRAPVTAIAERGVVARLDECDPGWCRIRAGGRRGWVPVAALWGVAEGDLAD